jgi:acetyl-CoA carboxylase biotin carboxyl carrier protein
MDLSMLKQMVELMSANDVSALDVRDGARRVILKRGPQVVSAPAVSYAPAPAVHAPAPAHSPAPAAPAAKPAGDKPAAAAADDTAGMVAIKSPMVGTFYATPSPDAKPFVSVGSVVDEDTDVCVIEAMKVFNNIKAETRGSIAKVLVSSGQSVEFGQVLFYVKPQ